MNVLELVLSAKPLAVANWWSNTKSTRHQFPRSIERAVALGAQSDRLGHAFLGGYTSAITALDPSIGPDEVGALCATESGGGHPRAILTTLADGRLNGTKNFVTGGNLATVLLVVAKTGEREGRPELKVARVAARSPGVTIEEGATLDFVPEVPHGAVVFKDTPVDAVLEGDGYEHALKPFRTIEDLHVFGAVLACVVSNGREVLPQGRIEQLLGVLSAVLHLGRGDYRSPATHLALAGVIGSAKGVLDSLEVEKLQPGFRERLARDLPLLSIASRVREQRRVKAWSRLTSAGGEGAR